MELQVLATLGVTRVFILKLQVANYELNLELQFSKRFVESNIETASCENFIWVKLLSCMLLKWVTENLICSN